MSRIRSAVLAAALGSALAACSDSTGNGLPNIVGVWTLTKFEFVSIASPSTKTDLIAVGAHGTITFNSGGTWSTLVTLTGQNPLSTSGTYTEAAASLTITVTSETPTQTTTFDMVVSGSTLALTGGTGTFDFGAGEIPAHINITATK